MSAQGTREPIVLDGARFRQLGEGDVDLNAVAHAEYRKRRARS